MQKKDENGKENAAMNWSPKGGIKGEKCGGVNTKCSVPAKKRNRRKKKRKRGKLELKGKSVAIADSGGKKGGKATHYTLIAE